METTIRNSSAKTTTFIFSPPSGHHPWKNRLEYPNSGITTISNTPSSSKKTSVCSTRLGSSMPSTESHPPWSLSINSSLKSSSHKSYNLTLSQSKRPFSTISSSPLLKGTGSISLSSPGKSFTQPTASPEREPSVSPCIPNGTIPISTPTSSLITISIYQISLLTTYKYGSTISSISN